MSPHKVESQYLSTHMELLAGATIKGKFQDTKLFYVMSQFCASHSLTHESQQQKCGAKEAWKREREEAFTC